MKKVLLLSALALFGMLNSNAQSKFGVRGGYSLANMKAKDMGDASYENDPKSTFYIGGVLEHKLSDHLAIQGELIYTSLGTKVTSNNSYGPYYMNIESKVNVGELVVPIAVKYYPNQEGFALLGGVNFGFIVSAEQKTDMSYNVPVPLPGYIMDQIGTIDIKDELKTMDIAPFVGVEYNFPNGLFIETRYNIGVTNISDIKSDEIGGVVVYDMPKVFNRYWQLGLGYRF